MGLWLLNGTSVCSHGATSFHFLYYENAQSVVNYALASPIAHALGICMHVEGPLFGPFRPWDLLCGAASTA